MAERSRPFPTRTKCNTSVGHCLPPPHGYLLIDGGSKPPPYIVKPYKQVKKDFSESFSGKSFLRCFSCIYLETENLFTVDNAENITIDGITMCGTRADAVNGTEKYESPISFGEYMLALNEYGGIGRFTHGNTEIIKQNNEPILQYHSYSKADYDFWFTHYARNMKQNGGWAYPDFGRPLLKYAEGKYPTGRFFYKMTDSRVCETADGAKVFVNLQCDRKLCEELGAPRNVQIVYTLLAEGLHFSLLWTGKDANRLTEAIFLHLCPACTGDNFRLQKIGAEIDYRTTASMGGRNLHAVEKSVLHTADGKYDFVSLHAPLISIGKGKILEYDNKIEDIEKDGISYVLYDNVWGTNFPLWYADNARFDFVIAPEKEETL